jgi:hypothetical protein
MDLFGVIFFMLLALSSLGLGEGDLERLRSWSGVLICAVWRPFPGPRSCGATPSQESTRVAWFPVSTGRAACS